MGVRNNSIYLSLIQERMREVTVVGVREWPAWAVNKSSTQLNSLLTRSRERSVHVKGTIGQAMLNWPHDRSFAEP